MYISHDCSNTKQRKINERFKKKIEAAKQKCLDKHDANLKESMKRLKIYYRELSKRRTARFILRKILQHTKQKSQKHNKNPFHGGKMKFHIR